MFLPHVQRKEWTWDESKMVVMHDPVYRYVPGVHPGCFHPALGGAELSSCLFHLWEGWRSKLHEKLTRLQNYCWRRTYFIHFWD